MTQEHPITPPPELVRDWAQKAQLLSGDDPVSFAELLCNKAARWGADQQLEQDAKWLDTNALFSHNLTISPSGDALRQEMRPKPPSLKEQALDQLRSIQIDLTRCGMGIGVETIRCALESLPD